MHDEDVVVYYEPTLYVYDLTKESPQVLVELASANTTRYSYIYGTTTPSSALLPPATPTWAI